MKKILGTAMAFGLAALLSAAPQTGTPQTDQKKQTNSTTDGKHHDKKPAKHHDKKHQGDQGGEKTQKPDTTGAKVKPVK